MTIKEALAYAVKEIQPRIDDTLSHEVFSDIAYVEAEMIDKVVLEVYSPEVYARRDMPPETLFGASAGGIGDPNSIVIKNEGKPLNGKLEVINIAKANKGGVRDKKREVAKKAPYKNLAELIEYGHDEYPHDYGYDFTDARDTSYLEPRPFTEETIEELRRSKSYVKELKRGLTARGLKVQ